MRIRTAPSLPLPLVAVYGTGLVGFALYTRSFLSSFAETYRTVFTYWDAVLALVGSGYVICYWVIPFAVWYNLRGVEGNARPDSLIRYATRTDWVVAQGRQSLPWIFVLAGGQLVIALAAALGHPFTWAWGPASAGTSVLLQVPEVTRSLPLPVLSVVLQVLALCSTLFALTLVTAAVAVTDRPRTTTLMGAALIIWSVVSFRTDGWFSDMFGVATYALPWLAERALPFGPGGGVMVLLLAGALLYSSARSWEIQGPRRFAVPRVAISIALGAVTLSGLAVTLPREERGPAFVTLILLQGVGPDGVAILHYLANVILVLIPSVLVHRDLVSSLSGRRYAEMIRHASPARWYGRRFGAVAAFSTGYGLAMAASATLLVTARLRTPPDSDALLLSGLWGLALSAQVIVVVVMLALGTVLTRRVEGAAYACAAALVLSWPAGAVSRWFPAGQASLARMTDLSSKSAADAQPLPLIVLPLWMIVLGVATLILFNRTRGEIL